MNSHYENIHRYDFLTKEILEEEYLTNGLSDAQIAKKFGMPSKTVVWRKRKQFGISNRYSAKSNRHAVTNRKHSITQTKAEQLIADGYTFAEIAEHMGCSVMVAKRRFKEMGLCKTQEHAEKYKFWDVELTDEQKQMIIGSVLGDGTIAKHGAYSCSHSIKQKEYHTHKIQTLASIHSGKVQHAVHKAQGVNGEHHESVHFTTGCNKFCGLLRATFYPKGKKIFPLDFLLANLDERGLAYWYMDDGSAAWNDDYRSNSAGAQIITLGYTYPEQQLMQRLFNKFGLVSRIVYCNSKGGHIQQFPTVETPKLFALIRPHIVPSMRYKVDYDVYKQSQSDPVKSD